MIELRGLAGPVAGRRFRIDRFPARLGRSPTCELCIPAPGVWEEHLCFDWDRSGGIHVRALGQAGLLINGQPTSQARLRIGDQITAGSLVLQFALSPARSRRLWLASGVAWFLVFGALVSQVILLWWLGS